MLNRMTRRQFNEWMAIHELEPWGDEKTEYQFDRLEHLIATVGAVLIAVMWMSETESPPAPAEFLQPKPNEQHEPGSLDDIVIDESLAEQDAQREIAAFTAAFQT